MQSDETPLLEEQNESVAPYHHKVIPHPCSYHTIVKIAPDDALSETLVENTGYACYLKSENAEMKEKYYAATNHTTVPAHKCEERDL